MKFLHYLIALPLLAAAAWAVYGAEASAEGISFLPWSEYCLNTNVVLTVFLLYGYTFGRINSWFMYAPLRRELRKQKKSNKTLNLEHEKLNKTVSNLKQDIVDLQEKARKENLLSQPDKTPSIFQRWLAAFKKNKKED